MKLLHFLSDRFSATSKEVSPQKLFRRLAEMEDISYAPEAECYARTHILCKKILSMGLTPGKAWAFRTDQQNLAFGWKYHVAPTVEIQGKLLILDPVISRKPLTLEEWGCEVGAHPDKVQAVKFGEVPVGCTGDYTPQTMTDADTDYMAQHRVKLDVIKTKKVRMTV